MTAPVDRADPRAARLRTAARRLSEAGRGGVQAPRLARMAGTEPGDWTEAMIDAAAATLVDLRTELVTVGVDPVLLPAPQPRLELVDATTTDQGTQPGKGAVPSAPEPVAHEPVAHEPFVYDGTIDGLRGIPLTELHAVSDKAAGRFAACGMESIYDLLTHVPLRYIDRSQRTPIIDMREGDVGTTIAHVTFTSLDNTKTGRKVAKVQIADDTAKLTASFFDAPWQSRRFQKGDEVVVQGRLDVWEHPGTGDRRLQMTNPLIDKVGDQTAFIVPVYPQSAKADLTTWAIHRAAMEAVARLGNLSDPIPADLTSARGLMDRTTAYRLVHRPDHAGEEKNARDRLAYDELLRMQMALLMHKHNEQAGTGIAHQPTGHLTGQLLDTLPYPLTAAQTRAIGEIVADMRRPYPMNRLLQGDVGSGKTVVGLGAILSAIEGGNQAALMAPTEVLATQHHLEIATLLESIANPHTGKPLRVIALTNKVRSKTRRANLAALAAGEVDLVVGTHALLADDVHFHRLGLVVIDEQHRFGVEQRAALRDKGDATAADMLVMTATPIPRTAAMTVFGDLDQSVLDELPPGRTPITTQWVEEDVNLSDPDADPWPLVRSQVQQGRQAYVVCPLVTESETQAAQSAVETLDALTHGALAGLRVGLVHGKQKPAERDDAMREFTTGAVDVLVATTVIEVGVNVPNASVIVVLDPGRFGMAQLHQLRGRVGRGEHASHCVLVGAGTSGDATRRLGALCESTDGFALSEVDLEIRGEGAVFGARQSGMSDLRVASLRDDRDLVLAARDDAGTLLDGDEGLARRPGLRAEVRTALGDDAEAWLTRS